MAKAPNQNNRLVLAYYPDLPAGQRAADELKKWDKASDAVKLGGIGLLEYVNGKVQVHKVGARFGLPEMGKYGKVGVAIGVLAGIFSGGLTILGGAALGSVLGMLAGALSHRDLGMTDAEHAEITLHIEKGGAALGVMADDFEVEDIKEKLTELGGTTKSFAIPQAKLDQIVGADNADAAADPANT